MNPAHFLPQVSLQRNRIDNAGATALARTLQCGVLPCLEVLDLSSNLIAVDGAIAFASTKVPAKPAPATLHAK